MKQVFSPSLSLTGWENSTFFARISFSRIANLDILFHFIRKAGKLVLLFKSNLNFRSWCFQKNLKKLTVSRSYFKIWKTITKTGHAFFAQLAKIGKVRSQRRFVDCESRERSVCSQKSGKDKYCRHIAETFSKF